MPRLTEKFQNRQEALLKGRAVAAVIGALAANGLSSQPALAKAETAHKSHDKYLPTRVLNRRTTIRLNEQKPIHWLNGTLLITEITPGKGATGRQKVNNDPILVYRGHAATRADYARFKPNGDNRGFAAGQISGRHSDKKYPEVILEPWNNRTMSFVAHGKGDLVNTVVFQSDKAGTIQIDQPFNNLGPDGHLLANELGKPTSIAEAHWRNTGITG